MSILKILKVRFDSACSWTNYKLPPTIPSASLSSFHFLNI
jgi:hypothetical protein